VNIAIDYDKTISRDPLLFMQLIELCVMGGHTVYIVSGRKEDYQPEDMEWLRNSHLVSDVLITNWESKAAYCAANGYMIDVWIDDNPEAIIYAWDGECCHSPYVTSPIKEDK
jgi:hypothetical protein